jgi:cell division protein ZapA
MEKRQLRIDVLGTSFVIQSQESPEHLAMLSTFVRERIEEVKARYAFADPLTVAVLAALNIADDFFKARDGRPPSSQVTEIQTVAERLINRIDEVLAEEAPPEAGRQDTLGLDVEGRDVEGRDIEGQDGELNGEPGADLDEDAQSSEGRPDPDR